MRRWVSAHAEVLTYLVLLLLNVLLVCWWLAGYHSFLTVAVSIVTLDFFVWLVIRLIWNDTDEGTKK